MIIRKWKPQCKAYFRTIGSSNALNAAVKISHAKKEKIFAINADMSLNR